MEQLLSQINIVFKEVFEDSTVEVDLKTSANDINKWDSLNHVMLIAALENKFSISFELDEMIEFKNVGDIVKSIKSKIG